MNVTKKILIMTPIRIQRKRTKGFNLKAESEKLNGLPVVYVGRGTKWGNPFKIGERLQKVCGFNSMILNGISTKKQWINNTPIDINQVCKLYEIHIRFMIKINPEKYNILQLKGNNLACWCSLSGKCHADVLLKLANK